MTPEPATFPPPPVCPTRTCCTYCAASRENCPLVVGRGQSLVVTLSPCFLSSFQSSLSQASLSHPSPCSVAPELSPCLLGCSALYVCRFPSWKATPTYLPCRHLEVSPQASAPARSPGTLPPLPVPLPMPCVLGMCPLDDQDDCGIVMLCVAVSLISRAPLQGIVQSESPPCPAQAFAGQGPSKHLANK